MYQRHRLRSKVFASAQVIDAQVDRRLRDFVEEVQVVLDSLDE